MKYRLLIVIIFALSLGTICGFASASDITGNWAFSISLDGGPQNVPMSFTFKQQGDKLTGSQSDVSGETKVTGTVKGDKVSFSVEGKNRNGDPYKNNFTGTIESPAKMSGTCEYPKGQGKWTATKK